MTSLTEFILARIGEDETAARLTSPGPWKARWGSDRVLAECDAKRAIIDQAFTVASIIDGEWGCVHSANEIRTGFADGEPLPTGCTAIDDSEAFLKLLALPYADHPSFQEEWRS